jgi:hypothetical protein
MKQTKMTEHQLQVMCVTWFRLQYPKHSELLFAVPNGGFRGMATAKKLKAEGVVSGVADLILLYPTIGYHGLCIEMKNGKGVQSPRQKEWAQAVRENGYAYMVVRSLHTFQELVERYIGQRALPDMQVKDKVFRVSKDGTQKEAAIVHRA